MEAEPILTSWLIQLLILATLSPVGIAIIGGLIVALLLLASAAISGSEIAFFSLSPNDKKALEEENLTSNKNILDLISQPRMLLATILIGNNFVNIAIVLVSDFVIQLLLPESIKANTLAHFLITVIGVTFLLVLFGEIAPKVYANQFNIRLSRFMAKPLIALRTLFYLPATALVSGGALLENRLGKRANNATSREDIDEAIDLTVSYEQGTEEEADLLKSILKFGEVAVKQIMQPRIDIVALNNKLGYHEVLSIVKESGYSRIPVFEHDLDHLVGILYAKDLIGSLDQDDNFDWQRLVRTEMLIVPEAKKIDDLLKEIQLQRKHLAIVVDEYGGTVGLVTLEDILEEIVGEIKDEFDDEPEVDYRKIDAFNFEFEGKTLINDFCKVIDIQVEIFDDIRGDADSLAGMVLEITKRFPNKNQKITYSDYTFTITDVSKRRIEHIMVTLPKD